MIGQHELLNDVSDLLDKGVLRTTLDQSLGTINAANLKRAHALAGEWPIRGKIVLEGCSASKRAASVTLVIPGARKRELRCAIAHLRIPKLLLAVSITSRIRVRAIARPRKTSYAMVCTMPPSTRNDAPLVAAASFELIIDHHVGDFLDAGEASEQRGRTVLLDEFAAASSTDWPFCLARSLT